MTTNKPAAIRFMLHYVTNGTVKARCWYSLDNHVRHARCVTIYAKDYSRDLGKIFADYQNDTDSMTDYFDKGRVTLTEGHAHYAAARAAAEKQDVAREAQRDRTNAKRAERAAARNAELLKPVSHNHIYGDRTCRCQWCVDKRLKESSSALALLRSSQV